jgi:hypothetical protein
MTMYVVKYFEYCGSGSGLDPDSKMSLDPDLDPGGQMTHKNRKK